MNQSDRLILSFNLLRSIYQIGGETRLNEIKNDEFNDEGWRVIKILDTNFVHVVEFKNEDAKLIFLLKYGNGKDYGCDV